LGRKWIGIDINQAYIEMSKKRLAERILNFDSYDPRMERIPRDLPQKQTDEQMTLLES
jgi:site-specific DNA-methyltransferase (adenine-specific)